MRIYKLLLLVVEYKGKQLATNDDSREKTLLVNCGQRKVTGSAYSLWQS